MLELHSHVLDHQLVRILTFCLGHVASCIAINLRPLLQDSSFNTSQLEPIKTQCF